MTPVFIQIKYFLNTVAIGLVIGLVFDFYRTIRSFIHPRKWTADLLDVLISIFLTFMAFLLLLFSNWGEVRFYVFLGMGLGLGIYFKYFSAQILSLWFHWFSFLAKSVKMVLKVLFLPLRLLVKLVAFPLGLISMFIYKTGKLVKAILKKAAKKFLDKLKVLLKVFPKSKKP